MRFATNGLLALALSTAVSAECWTTGAKADARDKDELTKGDNSGLKFICARMTSDGFLKGQRSSQCLALGDSQGDWGKKWDFYIVRTGGSGRLLGLSVDECVKNLRMEVVGCDRGGVRTHGNFKYS